MFSEFELYTRATLDTKDYYLEDADFDDLVQECIGGVVEAIDKYDASISSLDTFVRLVVERRAASAITKSSRNKVRVLTGASRLSAPIGPSSPDSIITLEDTLGDSTNDPARRLIGREFLEQVRPLMTELEYAVALHQVAGFSYSEMSEILSCDEKAIDNASQRVKRKLRPLIEGIL